MILSGNCLFGEEKPSTFTINIHGWYGHGCLVKNQHNIEVLLQISHLTLKRESRTHYPKNMSKKNNEEEGGGEGGGSGVS